MEMGKACQMNIHIINSILVYAINMYTMDSEIGRTGAKRKNPSN